MSRKKTQDMMTTEKAVAEQILDDVCMMQEKQLGCPVVRGQEMLDMQPSWNQAGAKLLRDGILAGRLGFCLHTPEQKMIGINTVWMDACDSIPLTAFAGLLTALYHEAQHMLRYRELETGRGNTLLQYMTLVDNVNPACYRKNYSNNIRELDAEIEGLLGASRTLQAYGFDRDLVNQVLWQICQRKTVFPTMHAGLDYNECRNAEHIAAELRRKMQRVLTGELAGLDISASQADPCFVYLNEHAYVRSVFLSIPDRFFEDRVTMLAQICLQVDPSICEEFSENRNLQLDFDEMLYRLECQYGRCCGNLFE